MCKGKGKGADIAVCENTSPLLEITCHMGSHSVTCHPAVVPFPPLTQLKMVLDLAPRRAARLSWLRLWLHTKIFYRQRRSPISKLTGKRHGQDSNPRPTVANPMSESVKICDAFNIHFSFNRILLCFMRSSFDTIRKYSTGSLKVTDSQPVHGTRSKQK